MAGHFQSLARALAGRRLVLHAGTPKTGSTALQCWLDQNRQPLLEQGILYPSNVSSSAKPKHQWLIDSLRPGQDGLLTAHANLLAQELRHSSAGSVHTVLLSTEGLYNQFCDIVAPMHGEWVELARSCPMQLVIIFRNPLEFSLSRYRQNIINPPSSNPFHGTAQSIEELSGNPEWLAALDYLPFVEFWEDLIGTQSVFCLPYSCANASCFTRVLDVELPSECMQLPPRNISPGKMAVELIRSVNAMQLGPAEREHRIKHICDAETAVGESKLPFRHSELSRSAVLSYCQFRYVDLVARYPQLTRELNSSTQPPVDSLLRPVLQGSDCFPPDLAFICCIQPGFLEEQVIALAQSIRIFAGVFRDCPIYVVSALGEALEKRTQLILEGLGAILIVAPLNDKLQHFPYANKAYALDYIERNHAHSVHVFLDSDTLFVDEPVGLWIKEVADFAARPVDLRGICSSPLDSLFRDYWESCCRLFDVELSGMQVVLSTVDKQPVYANWNGGLLAIRGDQGVGRRWRLVMETLWERNLCAKPRNFWGSGQVGFAIAVESLGLKGKILDAGYNIPLHLDPRAVGLSRIEQPKHLHYHWLLEQEHRREGLNRIQSLRLSEPALRHLAAMPAFQLSRGRACTGFADS